MRTIYPREQSSRSAQKCSWKFKSFLLTAARNNRRNCSHVILIFALDAEKHFHPFSISRKAHFSRMKKFLSWQKEIICFWRNKTSKMCRRMFTALASFISEKARRRKGKVPENFIFTIFEFSAWRTCKREFNKQHFDGTRRISCGRMMFEFDSEAAPWTVSMAKPANR